MKTTKSGSLLLILASLVAACDEETAPRSAPKPERSSAPAPEDDETDRGPIHGPPPVTIRYFDRSAELNAWTFCYENGCADGSPPKDLVDVGSPDEVLVEFPLEGWRFNASFTPSGERCGRVQHVPLERTGDGTFVLRPAGYADTYDVTLMGRGDGDLFTSFRWTTTTDGPLHEPRARLAVLAGDDSEILSYGIEMEVRNLAATPKQANATITVRSSEGNELTFEAKRSRGCWAEGTVYWNRPDEKGQEATRLGTAPFIYEVELRMDGKLYRATAVWPRDEIRGNEPSVSLDFEPALPALS